jgi:alkylation response protein AidB-like acyl-CoA dehydrogenase
MQHQSKAIAFDLDAASLMSLQEALPAWKIEELNGISTATVSRHWNPGVADLLVVCARTEVAETLGLCRFLVHSRRYSEDFRRLDAEQLWSDHSRSTGEPRLESPLLVLIRPGEHVLMGAALEAGADSCLVLPMRARDVLGALAQARGRQSARRPHAGFRPSSARESLAL